MLWLIDFSIINAIYFLCFYFWILQSKCLYKYVSNSFNLKYLHTIKPVATGCFLAGIGFEMNCLVATCQDTCYWPSVEVSEYLLDNKSLLVALVSRLSDNKHSYVSVLFRTNLVLIIKGVVNSWINWFAFSLPHPINFKNRQLLDQQNTILVTFIVWESWNQCYTFGCCRVLLWSAG